MTWRTHGKLILMGLATLVMALIAVYRDVAVGGITSSEWVTVVIAGFAVIVTWASANITGFEKAKTFVAAVMLVLNLLVSVIVDGVTTDEAMFLAIQFLGALGVSTAPAPKHVVEGTVIQR